MKAYPSITGQIQNLPIYAFDKLDGSNIRGEWSRKKGFYKFGTRTRLVDETDPVFKDAPELLRTKYEKDLSDIFRKERYDSAVCFFEYHGPSSFVGIHKPDEAHTVTLFDVAPYKRGILEPGEYMDLFGHLDIAKLLYRGNPNSDFIASVKEGRLEGLTFEGVICKAKNPKRTPAPVMFKVKNLAWIQRLREFCAGDEKKFNELL